MDEPLLCLCICDRCTQYYLKHNNCCGPHQSVNVEQEGGAGCGGTGWPGWLVKDLMRICTISLWPGEEDSEGGGGSSSSSTDWNLCVVSKFNIMYLPGDTLAMGIPFPGPLPEKVTKLLELILNNVNSHRIFVKRSGVLQVNSILASLCHSHNNLPRLSALFAGTAVVTLTQSASSNYNPTSICMKKHGIINVYM